MIQTGKAKMITYPCNFKPVLHRGTNNLRNEDSTQKVHLLRHMDYCVSFHVSLYNTQIVL
jgi:hypothetical protein